MKNIMKILGNIIGIISLLLVTYLLYLMVSIGFIPTKFLVIFGIIQYLFNLLFILFINKGKTTLKVISWILLIIMIIGSSIGIYYLGSTNKFLDKAFNNASGVHEVTYYVVTSKNSKYKDIDSLDKDVISYYKEEKNINKALNKLRKKITYTKYGYDDISLMFDELKNNKSNSMLISRTYYDLVTTIDKEHSADNYKVLYKFSLKEKLNIKKSNNTNSFNIFIGGKDFTDTNMDFNMIVTINTKTHKVLFTNIPRDYYMEVEGYDGKKDTLSYMGALGIDTNMKSIEKLFGIKFDYYLSVKTTSLVELVDAVGGINYCSDDEYTTTHAMVLGTYDDTKGKKLHVTKGCQHLNGIQTLTVARERLAHRGGDRKRQQNCQAIIVDIFEQLVSANTLTNYSSILDSVSDFYETNIPREIMTSIVKDTVTNGNKWKFESQLVNGVDTQDYVHMTNLKDWVTYPDMLTVNAAVTKINEVLENK